MARYDIEDQRNLEELLEEGFLDRFKARGAQALGAVKGLGQKFAGVKKAVSGGFTGDEDMIKAGIADVRNSKNTSKNAKIDYLKKNITNRINKLVVDLNNDIEKLGLDIGNIEFASDVENALERLKQNIQTTRSTPPPLPRDNSDTDDDTSTDDEDTSTDADEDVQGGYMAQRQQRSDRSKQAAAKRKAKRKQQESNPKKARPRNIQKTYDKNFVRENYDKLFWGE
jgi:hypothetical protein